MSEETGPAGHAGNEAPCRCVGTEAPCRRVGTEAPCRRVGIFGGTFDPVHYAHLALAHAALNALALDEIRWIPTRAPWYKDPAPTPAVHRAAMLQLAITGQAGDPRFVLDRIEIDREGPGYTLDTMRALRAAQPATEWVLVIGQDQYTALHRWHGWRELLGLVSLAVANRPGQPLLADAAVAAFAHRVVPLPMLDISATDIRERVRQARDIARLVPPEVARYIEVHRLYQATT